MSRWRLGRVARRLLGAAAVTAGCLVAAPAPPASAYPAASLSLLGHGWGHGRGMGQWGALGYALQGQGYSWILDHFYGGTSFGAALPNGPIRVRMVENDGNDVIVTSASPFTVAGIPFAAGQGALMHLTSTPNTWQIMRAPGCAGPWTQAGTASDQGSGPQPVAVPSTTDPNAAKTALLQLCQPSGPVYLRGSIGGAEVNGLARTVNTLPVESYVRAVAPSESPAYWGGVGAAGAQGQPQGFQALEAQAVAARSYAAADEASNGGTGSYGYADICDTTSCQVYRGVAAENASTDLAVSDTAGQVRRFPDGTVAGTEFSSSTGGWSAGGTFPAVSDAGDAVCTSSACNPNHNWSASVQVSSIESAYPTLGTLQAVQITSRSGPAQAADGGRVLDMTLQGSKGSVQLTGNSFASTFGLKSNWFSVVGVPSGGLNGYWIGAADGGVFTFGSAKFYGSTGGMRLNKPVVGMAPTPDGAGYWLVASDGGIFSFGDARFYGSTGAIRLNKPVVGMAPTPDGAGYWLVASDGGIFSFGDASFYGSTGAMTLNRPVIGMAPTRDAKGYWLVASDGGMFSFGDAKFYGSTGGRSIPAPIADMAATPDAAGYWLLGGDGAVYPFGDAADYGSFSSVGVTGKAVAIQPTVTGRGYLIATVDGRVYSFGDAPNYGGIPDQVPAYGGTVLAIAGHAGS